MRIHCIGLNHNTTPIHLCEEFAFSDDQVRASLTRFSCEHITDTIAEIIIISTCNRIEIHAVSNNNSFTKLEDLIFDAHGVPVNKQGPHLYRYINTETVHHLFNVIASERNERSNLPLIGNIRQTGDCFVAKNVPRNDI